MLFCLSGSRYASFTSPLYVWDEVAYLNVVFFEEEDDSNVVLERNYV